jgi:hypothetical protein
LKNKENGSFARVVFCCRMQNECWCGQFSAFFAEHSDIQYKFIEFTQNIFIETIYKAKFL